MNLLRLIVLFSIVISGCGSTDIDLPDQVDLYIVEGWVTDNPGPQTVKVSLTNSFLSPGSQIRITDAEIRVRDEDGFNYVYEYNPSAGLYVSDSTFTGVVGADYFIEVALSTGDTLISRMETLRPVHEINIVSFDFYETESEEDPGTDILVYYPVVFANDPEDEQNFYQWNVYKEDSLFEGPENLILLEDRFINGSLYKNEFTGFEFEEGDSIGMEVRSLNQQAFEYLNFFKNQTISLGTSSASSPGPIIGNMLNKNKPGETVLGYFGAVSIRRKGIRIIQ